MSSELFKETELADQLFAIATKRLINTMEFESEDEYTEWNLREILRSELESEGYLLRYNDADQLELIEFGGGYRTTLPYWERSTGNTFDSVWASHNWVFKS
jgi:hypothetical protein